MTYKELLGMARVADKLRFPRNRIGNWGRGMRFGASSTKVSGITCGTLYNPRLPVSGFDKRWSFEGVFGKDPGGVEGRNPLSGPET